MLTFLFLLFIIFFVVPIVRVVLTVHKMRSNARQAYEQMADQQRREAERRQQENRKSGWKTPSRKPKKFNKTDGEYVEWEEITEPTTNNTTSESEVKQSPSPKEEARISDADWEEIS